MEENSLLCLGEDSVFHSEAIFVVSAGDFEGVAFEDVGDDSAIDFISDFFIDELSHLFFVLKLDDFVATCLWT